MISSNIHPFVPLLLLSTLIIGGISLFAKKQYTAESNIFSLLMGAVTHYAITYSFELMSSTRQTMLFWVKLEYVGIVSIPVLFLLFTLVYTGRSQWLTARNVALLFTLPIITLLLVWTNEWHNLYYSTVTTTQTNGFLHLSFTPNIAFWINISYTYLLMLLSFILLIRAYTVAATIYRCQIAILLIGTLIPWIADAIYILFLQSRGSIDIAPATFTLSGIVMAFGLFRYQFLDLLPIARSKLIETMQDAWIVLDTQNRLVDLNPAAREILHLEQSKNMLIGAALETILPSTHPLLSCLTTNHTEITISADDAVQHTYDVHASTLMNQKQQVNGRLLVLHDISEQKKAKATIQDINHLKKLDEARNQFITNISHELRTPITNLILYLDLLELAPLSPKKEHYISVLRQQSEHLKHLAERVVELARLDSSYSNKNWSEIQLQTLIPAAICNNESHLRLNVTISDPPPPNLCGDPARIQQAINELIKNAIAFSEDTGELRIEVAHVIQKEEQWATITVSDDGPGIPLAEQEKVFERFYRGTAVSEKTISGLGLGLSIVSKIMGLHGGHITLSSQPNQGCSFTLWLPISPTINSSPFQKKTI